MAINVLWCVLSSEEADDRVVSKKRRVAACHISVTRTIALCQRCTTNPLSPQCHRGVAPSDEKEKDFFVTFLAPLHVVTR